VLNASARVVTCTRKFDHDLSQILHDELHWLEVPDQMFFKLAVLVHRCLNGRAPPYLSDYCVPVASAATRRYLRSANRQLLAVPRYRLNTYGRCAFSIACPTVWNSLPDFIRDPTNGHFHCISKVLSVRNEVLLRCIIIEKREIDFSEVSACLYKRISYMA